MTVQGHTELGEEAYSLPVQSTFFICFFLLHVVYTSVNPCNSSSASLLISFNHFCHSSQILLCLCSNRQTDGLKCWLVVTSIRETLSLGSESGRCCANLKSDTLVHKERLAGHRDDTKEDAIKAAATVSCCYILPSDVGLGERRKMSSSVSGSSVRQWKCGLHHTMLWWLFLSMMSEEGSSSFLIGEGGGVASFAPGLNRSDT